MNKRSFTLIELLVVIGIIAILAGILIPVVNGSMAKADATKAKAQITTLVNAIKQFEATYGYLPYQYYDDDNKKQSLISDEQVESDYYEKLIRILQAEEESTTKINTKEIRFLEIQGNEPGVYQDPWENNFIIFIDEDANGKIEKDNLNDFPLKKNSDDKVPTIYQNVVIYSKGPKDNIVKDNVYSFPVQWSETDKAYSISK